MPVQHEMEVRLAHSTQDSSDGKTDDSQTDGSDQEPLEVVEVGIGSHDMLRAGEDHPARLEPAHDKPIEMEKKQAPPAEVRATRGFG